jgi:hypothetical protein
VSRGAFSRRIFACSLLGLAFLLAYAPRATGDLGLSRTVWDFGSIEQGEVKNQKILITNSGDQPVKVDKVELPEGLSVTPSLDETAIEPQQDLEVEFQFDSAGTLGKIQQYAYIFPPGSDGKDILTLTIKGEVSEKSRPRLRVTPASWDFRTLTTGEKRKGKFTCENVGTADLRVEEILLNDRRFSIDKSRIAQLTGKPLPPGEKFEFDVEVDANYPGKYDIDFYIKSDSAGSNFTKVGIEGYVISKTRGVVISSNLLTVTNNTTYTAEVTKTDKEGKTQELTVERDKVEYFPRDTTTPATPFNPEDYTLTVKLVKPAPLPPPPRPTPPKPTEEKPEAEEKPGDEESPETTGPPPLPEVEPVKPAVPETPEEEKPAVPKPGEGEPAGAEPPSTEKPSETQPEKTEPSEETKPAEGEKPAPPEAEKTPEKPAEEQKPAAPSEAEKKPEGPPAAPKEGEGAKPTEGEASAPPAEPERPASPEEPPKDEEKKPPESE